MKHYLFFLLATIALVSCDDTQVNDVALQAKVDDRLYLSEDARAAMNPDGSFLIQGFTDEESLTLSITGLGEGTYEIGNGSSNHAIFEDMGGNLYTTSPDGDGTIIISEYNETNNTFTGTFNFKAILSGVDTIFVSKGVLYDVPYKGEDGGDPTNEGEFSANVDGNPFIPIVVSARDTGNTIIISASTVNATVTIAMPISVEAGSYTLPLGGFAAKYQDENGIQSVEEGITVVVEHNVSEKSISGTFSFTTALKEITQGKFNVTYD